MCYRPVGVSYAASTPVVWGGILIIGNNVHKTNNAPRMRVRCGMVTNWILEFP